MFSSARIDRNPKWRSNDIVFFEVCAQCGIKIEWQHERVDENNANNFRTFLRQQGWTMRSAGFLGLGGKEWICNNHR